MCCRYVYLSYRLVFFKDSFEFSDFISLCIC